MKTEKRVPFYLYSTDMGLLRVHLDHKRLLDENVKERIIQEIIRVSAREVKKYTKDHPIHTHNKESL